MAYLQLGACVTRTNHVWFSLTETGFTALTSSETAVRLIRSMNELLMIGVVASAMFVVILSAITALCVSTKPNTLRLTVDL